MKDSYEILAVDDTPANLEIIIETLSSVGYTVAATASGERALKRLQSYVPDLILLDVQMPGIDGFETCRQIKANPATASIPIIFVTAFSDTANIVRGFSLGGADYITKPFQELELIARVKTHLQLHTINQTLENQVAERTQDLKDALAQLQDSQLKLVQQEKMSALGNMMAGIAHELNNPIGFLSGNIQPAQTYTQDLLELIDVLLETTPQLHATASQKVDDIELDFLRQDLPNLFKSMAVGIHRIQDISTSLRTFARADKTTKTPFNIHDGLDSTLLILHHRLKSDGNRSAIEVIKHYGDIPAIPCFPGQLNQVFMNLLANAIDAIEEKLQQCPPDAEGADSPHIIIKTAATDDELWIHIQDTGIGMTDAVKQRIFDHLYTTKAIGKGTGLGLAIARQIIEDTHGGHITVQSEIGKGTSFRIQLPHILDRT